jgi:hypothetical protein
MSSNQLMQFVADVIVEIQSSYRARKILFGSSANEREGSKSWMEAQWTSRYIDTLFRPQ